eukprot:scaffold87466_cov49-Prasinocladus_malaysianus.AAC.1
MHIIAISQQLALLQRSIVGRLAIAAASRQHREKNIHPENILLTGDGFVKVTDFDCTCTENTNAFVRLQTPGLEYMPPEVAKYHFPAVHDGPKEERTDNPYTSAADVWAIGVMVYELLNHSLPFIAVCPSSPATCI